MRRTEITFVECSPRNSCPNRPECPELARSQQLEEPGPFLLHKTVLLVSEVEGLVLSLALVRHACKTRNERLKQLKEDDASLVER
jgi:hypothetical protein